VASIPQIWNQNRAQLPPTFGLKFPALLNSNFLPHFRLFFLSGKESFVKGARLPNENGEKF